MSFPVTTTVSTAGCLLMWAGHNGLILATMGRELQECRMAALPNEHVLWGKTKLAPCII